MNDYFGFLMKFHLLPSVKNSFLSLSAFAFIFVSFCSDGRVLTGRVLDNETQRPVRNANVIILGTTQGTITNFLGFFSINIEEQQKELVISSIGYFTSKIEIPATDQFKILLEREYVSLDQLNLHLYEHITLERPASSASTGNERVAERTAEYPGGLLHLFNDLGGILKTESLSTIINDSVLQIKFTITTEGDFNVNYQSTPQEIISVLSAGVISLPKWKPAIQNNLAVEQHFLLPVKWTKNIETQEEIFSVVDVSASPKNGYAAFYKLVGENIKYPATARRTGIEGKVFVEFIVNRDGSLTEFKVVRGIGGGCDEESIRVISLSPNWNPGTQRGLPVRQKMVIPITFSLGGTGNRSTTKNDEIVKYHFYDWISSTINYPVEARRMGIEGWVYIELKVNKTTGEIKNTKLLKDIEAGCGKEVLRVLSSVSPQAILNLFASKETLILPVGFGLSRIVKKPELSHYVNDEVEILKPVEIVAIGVEREKKVIGNPFSGSTPTTTININHPGVLPPPQSFSQASKKSTSLSFVGKGIETIPATINEFKNLKALDLENNLISDIPEEFCQLEKLNKLFIPVNRLKDLPASFSNLQGLKVLGLAQNRFSEFPLPLTKITGLVALDLADNKIRSLPAEIKNLKNLQELYLQNNEINHLPEELYQLTNLKKLYLEGNPIREEDKALLKQRLTNTEILF